MLEFSAHARRAMSVRGATEAEVLDTILEGTDRSARPPSLGRKKVFREGYMHRNRMAM